MTSDTASIPTESKEAVVPATAPATPATPPATEPAKGEATPPAADQQQSQSTADKVLGALKPAAEKQDAKEAPKGAPEKYESWKLPEGVKLTDGLNEAFTELARKAGLDQEGAQAQLDRLLTAQQAKVQEDLRSQVQGWGDALAADPELGGDKLESETMPNVARFLTAYDADGSLRELLLSGLGAHPAIVRVFAKAGKATKETSEIVTGPRSAPQGDDFAGLYVNTKF